MSKYAANHMDGAGEIKVNVKDTNLDIFCKLMCLGFGRLQNTVTERLALLLCIWEIKPSLKNQLS
jgi:hypothetical protein